jgi:hypothetical protein
MTFLKLFFLFNLIALVFGDISRGVNLDILCYPRKIILNQTFYINIKYLSYLERSSDIYLQFYNTNDTIFLEYKMEMNKQLGYVSIGSIINDTLLENIKTKILITPRNESKINILTTKTLNLLVAKEKDNNCKYFLYQGYTPSLVPSIDSVLILSYETHLIPNSIMKININYNLVSLDNAILKFYLMSKNNKNIITGNDIIIHKGINNVMANIIVPSVVIHNALYTTIYVVVYMIPINSSVICSLAEDKTYLLNFIK